MSKQDFINTQTHVLSVNFRCKCEGCKRRIKKQLQKIDGVYATSIDAEQGKVSVTGSVDPNVLVKKLGRSGKHAEIWSSDKGLTVFKTKNADHFEVVKNQLKNLQMSKIDKKPEEKLGKDPQPHKQIAIQQLLQEMKDSGDSKPPPIKANDDVSDDEDDGVAFDDDGGDNQTKVVHVTGNGEMKGAGDDKKGGGGVMSKMIGRGRAIGGKKPKGGVEGKTVNKGIGEGKIGKRGGGGVFPDFEGTNHHTRGGGPGQGPEATQTVGTNESFVGPIYGDPYQQQGMMNMYGRGPPGGGYYAPPMIQPAYQDPATNMFSDENPESCSLM